MDTVYRMWGDYIEEARKMAAIYAALLRQRKGPNWQHPYTITILSPSSIITLCICLLGLLGIFLVVAGFAGIALGPVLVWMGWSLLKFVVGMLLLLFLFRLMLRLLETLLRAARRSQYARYLFQQTRPWLLFTLVCLRMAARAFWRWYQDQQRGA
jgi:hypothetical protein